MNKVIEVCHIATRQNHSNSMQNQSIFLYSVGVNPVLDLKNRMKSLASSFPVFQAISFTVSVLCFNSTFDSRITISLKRSCADFPVAAFTHLFKWLGDTASMLAYSATECFSYMYRESLFLYRCAILKDAFSVIFPFVVNCRTSKNNARRFTLIISKSIFSWFVYSNSSLFRIFVT